MLAIRKFIPGIKLYLLTAFVPFCFTLVTPIVFILGTKTKYGFFDTIIHIWRDFYYDGVFLNIEMWRYQLCILLFCLIYKVFDTDN